DVEVDDVWRDLGDQLERAGAGADASDPLAGQIHAVVPAGGVQHLAPEGFDPVDVGHDRALERPDGVDDVASGDLAGSIRVLDGDTPQVVGLLEGHGGDRGVEPHPGAQVAPLDDVLGIGQQLRAGREDPRPTAALLVAEAVHERGDVHGDARVAVGPPRAAGTVPLLEDHVVLHAHGLELDRRPDAAEAGADDDDVVVGHGRERCARRWAHRPTLAPRRMRFWYTPGGSIAITLNSWASGPMNTRRLFRATPSRM